VINVKVKRDSSGGCKVNTTREPSEWQRQIKILWGNEEYKQYHICKVDGVFATAERKCCRKKRVNVWLVEAINK
jgi:hypothetical protein